LDYSAHNDKHTKSGIKVYYSDKSESSFEDLMDITPAAYNLPNGRLNDETIASNEESKYS